jgi:hypothetical protein
LALLALAFVFHLALRKTGIQEGVRGYRIIRYALTLVTIVAILTLIAVFGLKAYEIHKTAPSTIKEAVSPVIKEAISPVLGRIDVVNELGNDIQNLSVVLAFREPLPASMLKDESVLAFLRREELPFPYIEAFGEVSHIGTGPNEAPISIYFSGKSSPDGRHVVGPKDLTF